MARIKDYKEFLEMFHQFLNEFKNSLKFLRNPNFSILKNTSSKNKLSQSYEKLTLIPLLFNPIRVIY